MAPRKPGDRAPRRRLSGPGRFLERGVALAVVGLLALTSACGGFATDPEAEAIWAMPGYLDDFVAADGILMVPQLRHEVESPAAVEFAGDIRATYLYVMIESLVGRPFVDSNLAAKVEAYETSTGSAQKWEKALNGRLSERLRGQTEVRGGSGLSWIPELGGSGWEIPS